MPHWLALRLLPSESPSGPPAEVAAQALGWWALQFTPRVRLLDEAVLLEVQASLRLFGGAPALHARLRQELAAWQQDWAGGMVADAAVQPVAIAAGPTCLAALALLRAGQGGWLDQSGEPDAAALLDALPLQVLSAAAPHEPTLSRMGCRSLGQLRALPRGGLGRRFGSGLLLALDQACGDAPEVHDWLSLPEVFDQAMELPGRVDEAPALMFAAQRLLAQLASWLAARHAGVRSIRLGWRHDFFGPRQAGAGGELVIRTADCTRRVDHLSRLLAEQLARTELAAPVGAIALRADEVEPLAPPSDTLWAGVGAAAEQAGRQQWIQLVERLSARLGPSQVRCAQPRADHRLQAQQIWVPASEAQVRPAAALPAGPGPAWPQPAWLVEQPLPLGTRGERPVYQGPLQLVAGPQRLESGWWAEAVDADADAAAGLPATADPAQPRDYYVAFSARAGLLCIYRERLPRPGGHGWFLHGFYG